ncbi:hypothetical protein [Absicoccus intestinalis]|uniref:Uncharacterized protein n=1 Tax=Absicoccus intestinalis TaxID=2926319 RepID=A0ABU4WIR8_9FIRM|nr:hypothetical protein [Absicoccus sp. CLA-KB-P134]MDX8416437.1 hypothetical protein [Absicoccus sp. CLA-KB-P134]
MKYSDIRKEKMEQKWLSIKIIPQRVRDWLTRFTLDQHKKQNAVDMYERRYLKGYVGTQIKKETSLPSKYYFTPQYIFTSDLIRSTDYISFRKDLKKLMLKQRTNKYFFASGETKHQIDNLKPNDPGVVFYRHIGMIDFGNNKDLRGVVDYVDINISNLNDSYFLLLLTIKLTEEEKSRLQNLISSDYTKANQFYTEYYVDKKTIKSVDKKIAKPGAQNYIAKVNAKDSIIKTDDLDTEFNRIKKEVFSIIGKYFKLELMQQDIIQPAYIIYGTNLDIGSNVQSEEDSDKEISMDFFESMGMPIYSNDNFFSFKQYFSNEKNSEVIYEHPSFDQSNRYVVYFENRIQCKEEYQDVEYQFYYEFFEYFKEIARLDYPSYLYDDYKNVILEYRRRINLLKINGKNYKKALNIRKKFANKIYFFQTACCPIEGNFNMSLSTIKYLKQDMINGSQNIVEYYIYLKSKSSKRLDEFYKNICSETNERINEMKDLSDKHQITKSNIMTTISILIAFASLLITLRSR